MMVTETETLTLTLHHNIFTYLDYIFSGTSTLSDFIQFYFHTVFSKNKYQIYSYITFNMDDSKRSKHMKTYLLRIAQ